MKRFKNILYIIESISTLPKISPIVQNLAKTNEAKVHIALVQEQIPSHNIGNPSFLRRMEKLRQHHKENHEEFLHSLLQNKDWSDIDLSGSIVPGIGFIEITRQVLKEKHDLIVIEEPTLTRIKIGQLALKLVRKSPCPVWIIRSQQGEDMSNILAAVDVQEGGENHDLNTKIIQLAGSLAHREQGKAHILHACNLDVESALSTGRFTLSAHEISAMKEDLMENSKVLMEKTIRDVPKDTGLNIREEQIILREGDPVEVIQQVIQEFSVDTLVMGSVARSDIPGFLMGNLAERILTEIECSVLTVKPDNFISPISLD